MPYAIMRAEKLSTKGSVAASLQHCYRERETPNADPIRTTANQNLAAKNSAEALQRMDALLPEKRRKDAVLVVEYMLGASPEWWKQASPVEQHQWQQASMKWVADKYGADRIITATMHRDESTPHLSVFVVPLTQDGRLSAKEFIGDRKKMADDQTTYAKAVEHLGLSRGIEGSRASHQSIKSHYAAIQQGEKTPDVPTITPEDIKPRKVGFMREEAEAAVADRINARIQAAVGPLAKRAAMVDQAERLAAGATKTVATVKQQAQHQVKEAQQGNAAALERERARSKGLSEQLDTFKTERLNVTKLILRGGEPLEKARQDLLAEQARVQAARGHDKDR